MRSSASTGASRFGQRLLEPAPLAAPQPLGVRAAQHRLARRSGRRAPAPEERHRGPVDPHHATPLVHRDDPLGGAVEDRREQRLLPRQLLAQLGGAEGDGQLVAHEAQEADPIGRQPRAVLRAQGQEPDHPGTQLALAQVRRSSSETPCQPVVASPGLRGSRGREPPAGWPGLAPRPGRGSLATSRRPPSPGAASHTAPATASLARTSSPITDPAMSARSPPSARSWLSWYCAKTVSAWRWASSKLLRSSASVRAAVPLGGAIRRASPAAPARGEERAEQQVARGGARVLVAARPLAQAQREAPSRDQRRGGVHAVTCRPDGRHDRHVPARARRDRRGEGVRGRSQRVVDRLVAQAAAAAPGETLCRRIEGAGRVLGRELGEPRDRDPGFDERRAVERSPGPAHARHQLVAQLAQEVAHVIRWVRRDDGPDGKGEPGGHVLAVIAVTKLGVEAVEEDPVAGEEALGAGDDGGEVGPGEGRGRAGVAGGRSRRRTPSRGGR